jgi:hypothetical protein
MLYLDPPYHLASSGADYLTIASDTEEVKLSRIAEMHHSSSREAIFPRLKLVIESSYQIIQCRDDACLFWRVVPMNWGNCCDVLCNYWHAPSPLLIID